MVPASFLSGCGHSLSAFCTPCRSKWPHKSQKLQFEAWRGGGGGGGRGKEKGGNGLLSIIDLPAWALLCASSRIGQADRSVARANEARRKGTERGKEREGKRRLAFASLMCMFMLETSFCSALTILQTIFFAAKGRKELRKGKKERGGKKGKRWA